MKKLNKSINFLRKPISPKRLAVEVQRAAVGELELALPFDEGLLGPVDHDVGDLGILEQRLKGAESKGLVLDLQDQTLPLDPGERNPLGAEPVHGRRHAGRGLCRDRNGCGGG